MDEDVFWRHYFFRVKYIRLLLGIERVNSNNVYTIMKALPEDDVIYKPTFEAPPKIKTVKIPSSPAPIPASSTSVSSSKSGVDNDDVKNDSSEVEDPEEKERQNVLETRRVAEAALAAEVEAELDDDDIDLTDLGDLDLGDDDVDDFDDLADLNDDNDDELEAQIALELAKEEKK